LATRTLALIRNEFIHIVRDPYMLMLALIAPVIDLVLFGYAINTTVEHLPTVVMDQADDRLSREFVAGLVNSSIFDVRHRAASASDVRDEIDRGAAKIGIIIAPDFARQLAAGQTASVQVLVDGSDPATAQAALYAIVALGESQSARALSERLARLGLGSTSGGVEVQPRLLYNPSMSGLNFMIPGLLGLGIQLQTIVFTAFSIVGEREQGTLEQLLVSPVRPIELMLGKMVPYVALAFADVIISVAVVVLWFHVVFAGSLLLLVGLSMVFLFAALGLGLFVSTVSQTLGQATQLAFLLQIPSMLLTGFIFPLETMPRPLQDLSQLIPLTYYLRVLRGIMLKGVGADVLWGDIWPMAVLGIAVFALSVSRFRKRM